MKRLLVIAPLVFELANPALGQDFEAGMAAYARSDYATALKEWRPLAEQGFPEAQYNLAEMYYEGRGVPQDYAEAARWFRKASNQGDAIAQFYLGVMYDNGKGVPQDPTQAVIWYQRAAQQGYTDAQANLGLMYAKGRGVPQDDTEAARWLRKAAPKGQANAQAALGLMYAKGEGIPQDYVEAVRWLREAASQGLAIAQVSLGVMYDNGTGVPQNRAEAMRLYRLAAEKGNALAQYNLGEMYYEGRSVAQDYTEAVRWFGKAAQQGDTDAQVALGHMYAKGQGVRRNDIEAMRLYGLAAKKGSAVAQHSLRLMAERHQTASVPPETGEERKDVRQVQRALATIGYYDGPVDGIAGPVTRAGIRAFQQGFGLTVTGEVSRELSGQLDLALAAFKEAQESSRQAKERRPPVTRPSQPALTGSGFIVSVQGHVLTNNHVISECSKVRIPSSSFVSVVARDTGSDLALLRVPPKKGGTTAKFGEGRGIRPGDNVVVVGYPLRGVLASEANVTTGTVSALAGPADDRRLFQMTAPVQPGNSGGPVLDASANVVGVVMAKLDAIRIARATGDIPQNVNFAISGSTTRLFLEKHGVPYVTAPSTDELRPADVAAVAKTFTVPIECWK